MFKNDDENDDIFYYYYSSTFLFFTLRCAPILSLCCRILCTGALQLKPIFYKCFADISSVVLQWYIYVCLEVVGKREKEKEG
jgi:hypothetical protein